MSIALQQVYVHLMNISYVKIIVFCKIQFTECRRHMLDNSLLASKKVQSIFYHVSICL